MGMRYSCASLVQMFRAKRGVAQLGDVCERRRGGRSEQKGVAVTWRLSRRKATQTEA